MPYTIHIFFYALHYSYILQCLTLFIYSSMPYTIHIFFNALHYSYILQCLTLFIYSSMPYTIHIFFNALHYSYILQCLTLFIYSSMPYTFGTFISNLNLLEAYLIHVKHPSHKYMVIFERCLHFMDLCLTLEYHDIRNVLQIYHN